LVPGTIPEKCPKSQPCQLAVEPGLVAKA